ncbi:MAG: UvrD-helicase domain-containing protein [Prevotella sp.]|nr:AAA family ATPase [Bacteroidaceae bacterium]
MTTLYDFLKASKSLMIAAAGHGKTYCIAECIKLCKENECQLILTHTHAGISSLKEKLNKQNIDTHKYSIQTISGFAQRLVFSYCNKSEIPFTQDNEQYFPYILKKTLILLSKENIKRIINISYQGVFVDEYQDCDIEQHSIIMLLSELIPVHIFGDPLQGIFDFNGTKVDFETDLSQFTKFDLLKKPWRWLINDNNAELGKHILQIRERLCSSQKDFYFTSNRKSGINVIIPKGENEIAQSRYISAVIKNIKSDSILILVPSYFDASQKRLRGDCNDRAIIKSRLSLFGYSLIEAIDEKDYYNTAAKIDDLLLKINRSRNKIKKIYKVLQRLTFNKTELDDWFDIKNGVVKKRRKTFAKDADKLSFLTSTFLTTTCSETLLPIIDFFLVERKAKIKRPGIAYANVKCIKNSISNKDSIFDNMNQHKNKIRMLGRKVYGRCIGTTLLTKGLEFDTVIILNADRIKDKRNFYVAISRACKNLYIISNSYNFHFEA